MYESAEGPNKPVGESSTKDPKPYFNISTTLTGCQVYGIYLFSILLFYNQFFILGTPGWCVDRIRGGRNPVSEICGPTSIAPVTSGAFCLASKIKTWQERTEEWLADMGTCSGQAVFT